MRYIPPRKVLTIYIIAMAAALVLAVAGAVAVSITLPLIGAGIAILANIFFLLWYRCPHCGRFLGRTWGKYCSYCGTKLEDGGK